MDSNTTYEESQQRIEAIINSLEKGDTSIDELLKQVREAKGLIAQCKEQLFGVEQELNEAIEAEDEEECN